MDFSTGTVSLIQLDDLFLAVSLADTLMIGQRSEVVVSEADGNSIGHFEYAGTQLPVYSLNDKLVADRDGMADNDSQFCIGMKTRDEADYFVLLCKQFEQVELSEQPHNIQELPTFMCKPKMMVEGMLDYQNIVYLVTSPDSLLSYIANNDLTQNLGENNA